jgi:GT2 family glycosyltransferase
MSPPSVSAVIITYFRRDLMAEAVRAIAADPYTAEIVVVVDGSTDGSHELLTEMAAADPRIRPIWQENGGDVAARRTGVKHSSGEVVLLLDDDVIAGPGLARGHALVHEGRPGLVVLGYMPTRRPAVRRPAAFTTDLYADDYEAQCRRYEDDPALVLRHFWAGNASMRRTDALRVLDSETPRLGYHEDQIFGLRCLRAGLTGVFDRGLTAEHRHERDLATFLRQARSSGAARRTVEAMFPDLLEPGSLEDDLPLPVRAAISVAAAPGVFQITQPAVHWNIRRAGQLRLWRTEALLGRYLRQIEMRRGHREHAARIRHPGTAGPVT